MICNFCHLRATRIQSPILVGCFLRDMSTNEIDCKNYKSCKVLSWGNKKDENNKYDRNCKKLGERQKQHAHTHANFFKNWLCPNFSCWPKNLSCPNFGGAPAPRLPPPHTPMPKLCYKLVFFPRNALCLT